MARTHARVQAALWGDEDWRALSAEAQRVYLLLISQPQINNVGVLPLVLKRWGRLAADTTPRGVADAIGELEEARFVVCDWESEEVLVRTFVKHDRVEAQPKLRIAAKRQLLEVESARIQHVLATTYEWLLEDLPEPLSIALREPLSKPLSEGVNAHAREGLQDAGVGGGSSGSSSASERELQDAHRSPAEDRTPQEEPVVVDLPDERLGAMAGSVRSELERLRPRGATA